MSLPPDDPRHGTTGGYSNHKCRCEACTRANRDYTREYTHRTGRNRPRAVYLAERYPAPPPHGTESRYSHGCRCDECRAAQAEARKRRRRANIEATRAYDREYKRKARAHG